MKIQDDRTPEQRETHCSLIAATDRFMSGWGEAEGGVSYAVWACRPVDYQAVKDWVSKRDEMLRVRHVSKNYKPRGRGHCYIYVVEDGHPALER